MNPVQSDQVGYVSLTDPLVLWIRSSGISSGTERMNLADDLPSWIEKMVPLDFSCIFPALSLGTSVDPSFHGRIPVIAFFGKSTIKVLPRSFVSPGCSVWQLVPDPTIQGSRSACPRGNISLSCGCHRSDTFFGEDHQSVFPRTVVMGRFFSHTSEKKEDQDHSHSNEYHTHDTPCFQVISRGITTGTHQECIHLVGGEDK